MYEVKYSYLGEEYREIIDECINSFKSNLLQGNFILRDDVSTLEKKVCKYLSSPHCFGVNSGTDALIMALKTLDLDPGSEIIIPAYSFVSGYLAAIFAEYSVKFCDVSLDQNISISSLEKTISDKTKAVLVVHMNGLPAKLDEIKNICKKNGTKIIEDCAQSFGSKYKGIFVGNFGEIAAFSLHPLKSFGIAGDGGLVLTNNDNYASKLKALRNLGQYKKGDYSIPGLNSRLDTIQAGIALIRLHNFNKTIEKKRKIAERYLLEISNEFIKKTCTINNEKENLFNTFSNFPIYVNNKEKFKNYLLEKGIESLPCWKILPSLKFINDKGIYENAEYIQKSCLNLPISSMLKENQVDYVIDTVNSYDG